VGAGRGVRVTKKSVSHEELEKEHEESTKIKNIQTIEMGRFEV
jgi:hypothetical protein